MSEKRIDLSEPMSLRAVQERAAQIKRDVGRNSYSRNSNFDTLTLDTLVGIARGDAADPEILRDDPVEVAREVLRLGQTLFTGAYDEPDTWTPWDKTAPPNPDTLP